ncbi:MAG: carbohydrate ABC transporter permease [Candidatus Nealsonbacteria bacterium]|nr:MAG: carbohydrate ABC transporter permease [Candidatus Nealsonbacteria bacterium]
MVNKEIWRKILFYSIISIIAVIIIIPFFWMISTSLKERGALMAIPIQWIPDKVSFEAYQKLFKIFPFGRAILNSMYVAIMTTFITISSAAMAAYVFAKIEFKGREKIFVLYLATLMIPSQVTMIPNFLVLKYMGLLNTFTGLMLPSLINAFATFILRQNMKVIPNDYIEAAVIDGASHFTIFYKVILPLSKPIIAALGIITFMGTWNSYLWPLIILTSRNKMTLPVGLSLLSGQHGAEYNLLMAGSLISIIPILIVFLFTQKYFEKGLSLGGIKG